MSKICVVIPTIYDHPLRYHLWDRLGVAGPVGKVVVIDNGSNCGTPERKKQKWRKNVYVRPGKNLHWAKSCNAGICWALKHGFEFFCLLNDDVKVQPEFFAALLDAWHAVESPGLVVPKYNGIFHVEAQDYSTLKSFKPEMREEEILYADGTCMLLHKSSLEAAGFLSEDFRDPNWGVDVDYCYRLRQAGLRLYLTHRTKLYHGHSTNGVSAGGKSATKLYGSKAAWQAKGKAQAIQDLSERYGEDWRNVLGLPPDSHT